MEGEFNALDTYRSQRLRRSVVGVVTLVTLVVGLYMGGVAAQSMARATIITAPPVTLPIGHCNSNGQCWNGRWWEPRLKLVGEPPLAEAPLVQPFPRVSALVDLTSEETRDARTGTLFTLPFTRITIVETETKCIYLARTYIGPGFIQMNVWEKAAGGCR